MTDKVQKIREEVERIINRRLNLLNGDYFDLHEETNGFTNEIMDTINSLQEEPVSKDLEAEIEMIRKYHFINDDFDKAELDRRNLQSYLIYEKVLELKCNRFYCFTKEDRELANTYYGNHNNMEIIDRKWQRTFEPAQNTIFRRLPIWI